MAGRRLVKGPGAPPHPRGSAPMVAIGNPAFGGSPAPAGIGPGKENTVTLQARLPRTRGDRP